MDFVTSAMTMVSLLGLSLIFSARVDEFPDAFPVCVP